MKKIQISLLSISTLVLITGCGFFDKKDLNDVSLLKESEKVVFEEGTYDLSHYLVPTKNQTNVYERVKFKDTAGNQQYGETPISMNDNERIEYAIDGNMVVEGDNTDYTFNELSILKKELVDDFYDIREYRRYVDVGDYYFSYESVDATSVLYQIGWLKCNVLEYRDEVAILDKNYQDVLIIGCESESSEGVRGEFKETKTFHTELYYAKDIGQIAAVGEECLNRDYTQTYKNCTRETKKLKEIIE